MAGTAGQKKAAGSDTIYDSGMIAGTRTAEAKDGYRHSERNNRDISGPGRQTDPVGQRLSGRSGTPGNITRQDAGGSGKS